MNPQKTHTERLNADTLASMEGMVASLPEAEQPPKTGLSPSAVLAGMMLILVVLAILQTYRRAMVTHDFVIIDDTGEIEEGL